MRTSLLPVFLFSVLLAACDSQSIEEGGTSTSCENNSHCYYPNNAEVWLSNPAVSPELPFAINLKLPKDAKNLSAKLEGVTMYMGFIPQKFTKEATIYKSDTMVGICSEKNMLWQLVLNLSNVQTGEQITHFYNFYVTY